MTESTHPGPVIRSSWIVSSPKQKNSTGFQKLNFVATMERAMSLFEEQFVGRNFCLFRKRAGKAECAFADDLYRNNIDPDYAIKDINLTFWEWQHREAISHAHIQNIDFDAPELTTAKDRKLVELPAADDLFASATRGEDIADIQNEHHRRMALVINDGFAGENGFDDVIQTVRKDWLLEGDDVIHAV
jgi:hypothetical protein